MFILNVIYPSDNWCLQRNSKVIINEIHTRLIDRAVARALIGGGGCIFIYPCSARLISFQIYSKTTDFKTNPSGMTRIYEYTPPPINALATALTIDTDLMLPFYLLHRIHLEKTFEILSKTKKQCNWAYLAE